ACRPRRARPTASREPRRGGARAPAHWRTGRGSARQIDTTARAPRTNNRTLRRRQQILQGRSLCPFVQKALVRRVLEQAADEVGHPGDQVADGAVRADPKPASRKRVLELVAEAA